MISNHSPVEMPTQKGNELRILWLCQMPLPASYQHYGVKYYPGPQSWIESLRIAFEPRTEIILGVASFGPWPYDMFQHGRTTYFNLPSNAPKGRIRNAFRAWCHNDAPGGWVQHIKGILLEFEPDIIHVHGTEHVLGLLAGKVSSPIVVSMQGILELCKRYVFLGFSARDVAKLFFTRDFVFGRNWVHTYLNISKRAVRELDIMRSNSHFIGRTEWDRWFVELVNPSSRYYHCDEVMRREFYGVEWNNSDSRKTIIYCTSSAMLFKGVEVLLEALSILRKAGIKGVSARIAGIPKQSDVWRFLIRRAKKFGVYEDVEWLGRVDANDIVRELLSCSVFVYPSHIDNSPNSLCEAMLTGVPCVCSAVGGIPSLMKNEEEGLLYDDKDPYALAGKILRLMQDRDLATMLGNNARRRALLRHDSHRIATRMVEVYNEVLGRDTRICPSCPVTGIF